MCQMPEKPQGKQLWRQCLDSSIEEETEDREVMASLSVTASQSRMHGTPSPIGSGTEDLAQLVGVSLVYM